MKKSIVVVMKAKSRKQDPQARIQKVSAGYAFNYLIPKQMAEIATKGKLKHLDMLHRIVSTNKDLIYDQNIKIKHKLESIEIIRIRRKCSPSKLIFGSISEQDIATKIVQLTGQEIDKQQIAINNYKKLGQYPIEIMIDESIKVTLSLHIMPKTI